MLNVLCISIIGRGNQAAEVVAYEVHTVPLRERSIDPVQRLARCGDGVNPTLDLRVVHEWRRMVRLDPGVDDERARASPMLLEDRGADSFDVRRGVGSGEGDPEEVIEVPRGEIGIVDDHDERVTADRILGTKATAECRDILRAFAVSGAFDREYSGHDELSESEAFREAK